MAGTNHCSQKSSCQKPPLDLKIEGFYKKAVASGNITRSAMTQSVISSLAEFFHVSKQAAAIRMVDLGYSEASVYCQYNDDAVQTESSKKSAVNFGKKNINNQLQNEKHLIYIAIMNL